MEDAAETTPLVLALDVVAVLLELARNEELLVAEPVERVEEAVMPVPTPSEDEATEEDTEAIMASTSALDVTAVPES